MLRHAAKALVRQIPAIDRLVKQRDELLQKVAFLQNSSIPAIPAPPVPSVSRTEALLAPISRSARIIEIGPSYNPIAPKAGGWNTITVDHATRAELVAKYTGAQDVDVDRIEEVDCIWTNGPLAEAVPHRLHGTFDALIASHVIEHATDLLGQAVLLRLFSARNHNRAGSLRPCGAAQPSHPPHCFRSARLCRQKCRRWRLGRRLGPSSDQRARFLQYAGAGWRGILHGERRSVGALCRHACLAIYACQFRAHHA